MKLNSRSNSRSDCRSNSKSKISCALALQLLLLGPLSRAVVIDRVAALVNDDAITLSDVHAYREKLKTAAPVDELLIPDAATKAHLIADSKALLEVMITEKILESEIKRQHLSVTSERVDQEVRSIASSFHLSPEEFKEALRQQGTTLSEYQETVRLRLERQQLIDRAITSKIRISDEDVAAAYLAKKHKWASEIYEYTLADIPFPAGNTEESARLAFERASHALSQIRDKEESFEAVASQNGDGGNGGLLGSFKAGEMLKEFESTVSHMEPGDVSEVIKARGAFHILKLIDRKLTPDPELEAHKEEIRRQLAEQAYKKQFQFWLGQKRQDAFIRRNL